MNRQIIIVRNVLRQAATVDAPFDSSHVHPAGMLGREVKLQSPKNPPGFGRREGDIQVPRSMTVEIIQDDADDLRFWIDFIHQSAHEVGKILLGMPLCNFDLAATSQRFKTDMQIAHPAAPDRTGK